MLRQFMNIMFVGSIPFYNRFLLRELSYKIDHIKPLEIFFCRIVSKSYFILCLVDVETST